MKLKIDDGDNSLKISLRKMDEGIWVETSHCFRTAVIAFNGTNDKVIIWKKRLLAAGFKEVEVRDY